MISPVSVVVVVLPLEPVMATIFPWRKRAVNSISPMTGMPRRRACCSGADVAGNAGADHNQVLIAEGALAVLAGFYRNAAVEQRGNFVCEADPRSWHR